MPANLVRGGITPNQRYVCLFCRQTSLLDGGRTTRYQHTGPQENDGGDTNQTSLQKNAGSHKEGESRSRIGEILSSFMFKPDTKDKETKVDSRNESLGEIKVHLAHSVSLNQTSRPAHSE